MVDVLNAVGIDWATFGNHEFDVSEAAFRAHLAQAKFRIVSSNVTDAAGQPFAGVPTSTIVPVTVDGRTVRIGLLAVTIDSTHKDWVRYRDAIAAARAEVERLRGRVDAIARSRTSRSTRTTSSSRRCPASTSCWAATSTSNWLMYRGGALRARREGRRERAVDGDRESCVRCRGHAAAGVDAPDADRRHDRRGSRRRRGRPAMGRARLRRVPPPGLHARGGGRHDDRAAGRPRVDRAQTAPASSPT
jgi:hypothetical protein